MIVALTVTFGQSGSVGRQGRTSGSSGGTFSYQAVRELTFTGGAGIVVPSGWTIERRTGRELLLLRSRFRATALVLVASGHSAEITTDLTAEIRATSPRGTRLGTPTAVVALKRSASFGQFVGQSFTGPVTGTAWALFLPSTGYRAFLSVSAATSQQFAAIRGDVETLLSSLSSS